MLYAKDFRDIARDSLTGKWPVAVGTGFVACLLGGSIFRGFNGTNTNLNDDSKREIYQWLHSDFGRILLPWFIGLFVLLIIWSIVIIVIGGAITLGYSQFNLDLINRKDPHFSDLFSQFHRIGAGFCMQFLRGIYILLWTLLLIIPGIIASYSYAMTPYIMSEHPEYGANEAIGYSKELMRGNKWRLFCMQISFIGWLVLCIFSLGIGFFWFVPYYEAANATFYLEISKVGDHWQSAGRTE